MRTPAAEEVPFEEPLRDANGARRRGDARIEAVPRVRGAHPAGALRPVERQRVHADLLAPECLFEAGAERLGPSHEPRRLPLVAEDAREARGGEVGGEDVSLHLAESDRRLGERSVPVEDGVERIPSLLHESRGGLAGVLDEAVLIGTSIPLDPAKRARRGQSAAANSRSAVRLQCAPASTTNSGVASTLP